VPSLFAISTLTYLHVIATAPVTACFWRAGNIVE
jgi:hypothetical protein